MNPVEPSGRGELLSGSQNTLMPTMKPIKDADGQNGTVLSRAVKLFALKRGPAEKMRISGEVLGAQLASTFGRGFGGAAFGEIKTRSG